MVLVSFFFLETSQASGVDRFTSKEVSSSLRGAATGIFVGHRDRCIDDRLGDQRHIFSSCDEFACFKTEVLLIYELSSGEPYEWNCNFIVLHPKFHVEKICQERFLVGIPSDQPTTTIYAC